MEYRIQKLESGDAERAKQLIIMFRKAFEEKEADEIPSDAYLGKILSQNGFHAFAAFAGDEIVGGVTAYEMPMLAKEETEMYLYDLAVDENHRRHGLATQLINELKKHAQKHNISTIFVEALETDTEAVGFYHSTGAEMEKVAHFNLKTS